MSKNDLISFKVVEIHPTDKIGRVLDRNLDFRLEFETKSQYIVLPESYIESQYNHKSYRSYGDTVVFSREERDDPNLLLEKSTYPRGKLLEEALGIMKRRNVVPLNVLVYLIERAARGDITNRGNMFSGVIETIARDIGSIIAITMRILNTITDVEQIISYDSILLTGSRYGMIPPMEILVNLRHRLANVVNQNDGMSIRFVNMLDTTVIQDLPFSLKTAITPFHWQTDFIVSLIKHVRSIYELEDGGTQLHTDSSTFVKYCNLLGANYENVDTDGRMQKLITPIFSTIINTIGSKSLRLTGSAALCKSMLSNASKNLDIHMDNSEQLVEVRALMEKKSSRFNAIIHAGFLNTPSRCRLMHLVRSVIEARATAGTPGNSMFEDVRLKCPTADSTRDKLFGYLTQIEESFGSGRVHPSLVSRTIPRKLYYIDSVAGSGKTSLVAMIMKALGDKISLVFCCSIDLKLDPAIKRCRPLELRNVIDNLKATKNQPIVVFFDEFCMDMKNSEPDLDALSIGAIDVLILSGATIPPLDRLQIDSTYCVEQKSANVFHTYISVNDIYGRTANPLALNQHFDRFLDSQMPMLSRFVNREVIERCITDAKDITTMQNDAIATLKADCTVNKLFSHSAMPPTFDWLKQIALRTFNAEHSTVLFCTDEEALIVAPILDALIKRLRSGDSINNIGLDSYLEIAKMFHDTIFVSAEQAVTLIDMLKDFDSKTISQRGLPKSSRVMMYRASNSANKISAKNTVSNHLEKVDIYKYLRYVKEFKDKNYDRNYNLYIGNQQSAYGINYPLLEEVFISPRFGIVTDTDTILQAMARVGRKECSNRAHAVISTALSTRLQMCTLDCQDTIIYVANCIDKLTEPERYSTDFFEYLKEIKLHPVIANLHMKLAIGILSDQLYAGNTRENHGTLNSMDQFIESCLPDYAESNDAVAIQDQGANVLRQKYPVGIVNITRANYNARRKQPFVSNYGVTRYVNTGTDKYDLENNDTVLDYDPGTIEFSLTKQPNRYNALIEQFEKMADEIEVLKSKHGSVSSELIEQSIEVESMLMNLRKGRDNIISVYDIHEAYKTIRSTMQSYSLVKLRSRKFVGLEYKIKVGDSNTVLSLDSSPQDIYSFVNPI